MVFLKSKRLVIGDTKGFINGKALSYEGHTHDLATYKQAGFMSSDDKSFLNYGSAFHYRRADTSMTNRFYKINIDTSGWMYAFTVRLYQSYAWYDIVISGYDYGTNYWYSPSAILLGSTADSIKVYFGHDAVNKLWIAIPGAMYPGLSIFNVTNGFYKNDPKFTITEVDSVPSTIDKEITAYRPANKNELSGYALSSHIHSNYATTATVNNLSTRITKLEGCVDMAKLVYTASLSFREDTKTIITYTNADYVIVKPVKRTESNSNSSFIPDDSIYKIMKGCSATCAVYCSSDKCISTVIITYNSDGTLTHNAYDSHSTTTYSGTLEFYKQ